eukprot:UN13194
MEYILCTLLVSDKDMLFDGDNSVLGTSSSSSTAELTEILCKIIFNHEKYTYRVFRWLYV